MAIRLFITDDHYMVTEGIRSLIQDEPDIIWLGHATNALSCLAFLEKQQPDVMLLDISMPDMNGLELCRIIKDKYPSVLIIGLSTFNEQSYIRKMIDQGASGYILKNSSKQELMDAIHEVMRGRVYLSDEVASALHAHQQTATPVITRREQEVLALIGEGCTNGDIAARLFISAFTVETHRKNLLAKFEVKNTASLIRKAAAMGLL